jgi:hypothetical protein
VLVLAERTVLANKPRRSKLRNNWSLPAKAVSAPVEINLNDIDFKLVKEKAKPPELLLFQ